MVLLLLTGAVLAFVMMLAYPRPTIPSFGDEAGQRQFERARDRFFLVKMGLCVVAVVLFTLATELAKHRAEERREISVGNTVHPTQ